MGQMNLIVLCLLGACVVTDGGELIYGCGEWSPLTSCSEQCGGGQVCRIRACMVQDVHNPEKGRLTTETDISPCNEQPCTQTCTDWSEWSPCSETCGSNAYRQRARYCGDRQCQYPDIDLDIEQCQDITCDGIDCRGPDCKWSTRKLGYHYDPENCNAYYTCTKRKGKITLSWQICPPGTVWNVHNLRCDHSLTPGTVCKPPSTAAPVTTTAGPPTTTPGCNRVRDPLKPWRYTMQIGFRVFEWFCEKYEIFNETTCTCQEKVNETIETPPPEEECQCLEFDFEQDPDAKGCNTARGDVPNGKLKYVEGRVGDYAASFNGKTRISLDLFSQWLDGSGGGCLTISMWVKPECGEGNTQEGLLINTDCTRNPSIDLHLLNYTIQGGIETSGSNGSMIFFTGNHTCPCGEWTHITMMHEQETLRLYKNCEIVEEVHNVTGTVLSLPLELFLGHGGKRDDQFYTGLMDDVIVCRQRHDPEEVEKLCER